MPEQYRRPDREGMHLLDLAEVRHEAAKEKVPRPDRARTVAMTARVPPRLRKFFSKIAVELDVSKNELHTAALKLLLSRFPVQSEWAANWEKLQAELRTSSGEATR